jgi:hypothetical protein
MKLPSLATENTNQLRQIINTTKCNLEALKAMNLHTETWDLMIIYILVHKLDNKTKREWELKFPVKSYQHCTSCTVFWSTGVMRWKVCRIDQRQMSQGKLVTGKHHTCT